ncbi:feruloyl-CoA synthase [Bradyrhizobium sp.]|uniref:feruloyl-CoA synthase n=1 Tax=Bradyrhizobium sp. TaxID=376 RepID=UPI002382D1DE|nr:feruloyl-CoA synthase [Bradyrhizobium sp.]MDE1933724.1 feruloyl-CoA synthase [Bradyrhizobium sp.]
MSAKADLSLQPKAAALRHGSAHPLRPISFGDPVVSVDRGADGTLYLRPSRPLTDYPARLTDSLHHWAERAPNRVFMAERDADGWRTISYGELLDLSRHIASGLLRRGLSAEKPLMILSGNSIDHALVSFGALYAGVPFCPVSPAYALISKDYGKLSYVMKLLTPGLVFVDDAVQFASALTANVPGDAEIVVSRGTLPGRAVTRLSELAATPLHPGLETVHQAVGPDTIAKFLLTSGSTGNPKAVINTQRMLCANQVMIRETMTFLKEDPPVIVDWLPWNHTFGGNHNVGLILNNGGTLYIDDGKPMPGGIEESIRNLREIAPTIYFNVPKGYEELVAYLEREPELARTFFSRVKMLFYAGAGLAQHVWDALERLAVATAGERIIMMTGLGATETAPFAIVTRPDCTGSGIVGLPVPGVELKLLPNGGKLEVRLRGPNIMPGYWRMPEVTQASFDEEGYYRIGDALAFVDEADWQKGFRFDGRISEDFKLSTGTWVSVGPLRAQLVQHLAPYVRDVVIAGHDADEVCILMLPDLAACAASCPGAADPLSDARLRDELRGRLVALARASTGSSTRVVRAAFLRAGLSIDDGEITDKGSINQRAVLASRRALVERLYTRPLAADIISIED